MHCIQEQIFLKEIIFQLRRVFFVFFFPVLFRVFFCFFSVVVCWLGLHWEVISRIGQPHFVEDLLPSWQKDFARKGWSVMLFWFA